MQLCTKGKKQKKNSKLNYAFNAACTVARSKNTVTAYYLLKTLRSRYTGHIITQYIVRYLNARNMVKSIVYSN